MALVMVLQKYGEVCVCVCVCVCAGGGVGIYVGSHVPNLLRNIHLAQRPDWQHFQDMFGHSS